MSSAQPRWSRSWASQKPIGVEAFRICPDQGALIGPLAVHADSHRAGRSADIEAGDFSALRPCESVIHIIVIKIITRKPALIVDATDSGADRTWRIDCRDRPVGCAHKAVPHACGLIGAHYVAPHI